MNQRQRSVHIGDVHFAVEVTGDERYGDFWSFFESGQFEPATVELVSEFSTGDLVIDVGAWIGPFALLAAAGGAEVVAFEPDPVACAALRRNVALNPSLAGRIDVREVALAKHGGRRRFGATVGLGNARSRFDEGTEEVTTVAADATLRALLAADRRTLLKIDIEGGEFEIMPVLGSVLASTSPTVLLSIHQPLGGPLTRLRRATAMRRMVAALRPYPVLYRSIDNRSAGWVKLTRWQRRLLVGRLGEFDVLARGR